MATLASGEGQVVNGLLVDRKDGGGRPVLRGHVANGGSGLERECSDAGTEGFNELADDLGLTEQLGDAEHEVGCGDALSERSGEAETDDLWEEHGDGLAEHCGLGFNAAHAPAQHAEAVDHGGVGVRADHGVAVGLTARGGEDHAGEVLQVDLVADADARGHDGEVVEGALGPLEELVALQVAVILNGHVLIERVRLARVLNDDRVVDHEFTGDEWVDDARVAAEGQDGVAHAGQVDDGRDTGEVLHEDALWGEGDLLGGIASGFAVLGGVVGPVEDGFDLTGPNGLAVFVAEEVLEQDLDGVGQSLHCLGVEAGGLQRENLVVSAVDGERLAGTEGIGVSSSHSSILPDGAAERIRWCAPATIRPWPVTTTDARPVR